MQHAAMRALRPLALCLSLLALTACVTATPDTDIADEIAAAPVARWDFRPEATEWTERSLQMLETEAAVLTEIVPDDIASWCPAYTLADRPQRAAFWVGFLSALTHHESTHRPEAVGGGGRWYGLSQILPATARGYGCEARSGQALLDGGANLQCALRIMAHTVARDNMVATGRQGVAADWGPLVQANKREEMRAWLLRQDYCRIVTNPA